jgi:hypothetical protein
LPAQRGVTLNKKKDIDLRYFLLVAIIVNSLAHSVWSLANFSQKSGSLPDKLLLEILL